MAYGHWPDYTPGTRFGPCAEPCAHIDCSKIREADFARCAGCGEDLKAGDRYYFTGDPSNRRPIHAEELEATT